MATYKPIHPSRGRAALLATACLVFPLTAGEPIGGGSLAERERMRLVAESTKDYAIITCDTEGRITSWPSVSVMKMAWS